MDGQQTIVTYTIGFTSGTVSCNARPRTAAARYFTANTADELADAFRATLNSIVSETESFVAPVVPVSQTTRTQSGDRLYIALFRPRDGSLRWPGNSRSTRCRPTASCSTPSGAAATDADGEILRARARYWDTTASGSAVSKGGVGEILLNRSTRRATSTPTSAAPTSRRPATRSPTATARSPRRCSARRPRPSAPRSSTTSTASTSTTTTRTPTSPRSAAGSSATPSTRCRWS